MIPLTRLPLSGLAEAIAELNEPSYRVTQLLGWLYRKRIDSFDRMNNVPRRLRGELGRHYTPGKPTVGYCRESAAGDAVKFGLLTGGRDDIIEAVLLYDGKRRTACLSSQLGCALGCSMCETGRMGFVRNLSQDEVVGQLLAMNDYLCARDDKPVTNIVFMGMGEALLNFSVLKTVLEIATSPHAFNLAARRVTVSTAGLVPLIDRLACELPAVGLAVSLNAPDDELRSRLMPITRAFPIGEILKAVRRYTGKTGREVTFEYVLIDGVNDSDACARALVSLLHGVSGKINLIHYNATGGTGTHPPPEQRVERFGGLVNAGGIPVTIRKSRGGDIDGACGQLRSRELPRIAKKAQALSGKSDT